MKSRKGSALRDSAYRTLSLASTAIDAGICIDFVVCVALGNSLNRALSSARAAADASITNNTCHSINLLISVRV